MYQHGLKHGKNRLRFRVIRLVGMEEASVGFSEQIVSEVYQNSEMIRILSRLW
jgi:hypothetical protein